MAAPDFYFAINATFRWIYDNWGEEGLKEYWRALGRDHYAFLTEKFRKEGMEAVYNYWQEFFAREPGGDVCVKKENNGVTIVVRVCPALKHLKAHGREIFPLYCQHCQIVSEAMCEGAGIRVRVDGGGGSCVQKFWKAEQGEKPPCNVSAS